MSKLNEKFVSAIKAVTEENIIRKEYLGSKNFADISNLLIEIRDIFIEMIDLIESNDVHEGFINSTSEFMKEYDGHIQNIKNYNIDTDANQNFQIRNNLIAIVKGYHRDIYSGANKLLLIYSSLRLNVNKDETKELNNLKKEYKDGKQKWNNLLKELSRRAGRETIADYAEIFKLQADIHSHRKFSKPNPLYKIHTFISIGRAESWIIIGSILLLITIIILPFLPKWLDIDYNDPSKYIPGIIQKIVYISLLLFSIKYSFKQFSINKHLHTINKHRQNTLDSFMIFLNTIDENDSDVRNTLMIEVARAIYEQGQSGYLLDKSLDRSSPSIIELTRLLGKKVD